MGTQGPLSKSAAPFLFERVLFAPDRRLNRSRSVPTAATRDRKVVAIEAAEYLQRMYPNSAVVVKDLRIQAGCGATLSTTLQGPQLV
jgi:hypothetical protein